MAVLRQAVLILLGVVGAGLGTKNEVTKGTEKDRGASQNEAVYVILGAMQKQLDSLKVELANEQEARQHDRLVNRVRTHYHYVREPEMYGPPEPGKRPNRAKRWITSLGRVLKGGK